MKNSGKMSVVPETLFLKGVRIHVVTVTLPKAWDILRNEFNPPQPFGALPEIQVRNDNANWSAMLGRDFFTLKCIRN